MTGRRKMPAQKPGQSEQDVSTPREFLDAVEARFGHISIDLACTRANKVCTYGLCVEDVDSLVVQWQQTYGLAWLNPPFGNIDPFAKKAAASGIRVAMLVPAAVGTAWFRTHVKPNAFTLFLEQRIKFVGHKSHFPKDLMLCMFGFHGFKGFDWWRWK